MVESRSEVIEEMLSVDWPLESLDEGSEIGAGGGGPRGL